MPATWSFDGDPGVIGICSEAGAIRLWRLALVHAAGTELFLCVPEAIHWAPLYFGLVVGFVALNFYLHCGVRLEWVERTLPRIFLNTSAFHNVHHQHVSANYGEAGIVWDRICKTRLGDASSDHAPEPT